MHVWQICWWTHLILVMHYVRFPPFVLLVGMFVLCLRANKYLYYWTYRYTYYESYTYINNTDTYYRNNGPKLKTANLAMAMITSTTLCWYCQSWYCQIITNIIFHKTLTISQKLLSNSFLKVFNLIRCFMYEGYFFLLLDDLLKSMRWFMPRRKIFLL